MIAGSWTVGAAGGSASADASADASTGDTNASEAVQVLQSAMAAYNCPELGSTMKVETAIQRLEGRRMALAS